MKRHLFTRAMDKPVDIIQTVRMFSSSVRIPSVEDLNSMDSGSAGGSGGSSKRKKGSSKNKDVSGEDENKDGSGGDENEDDSSALKKPRVVWSAELHQQFVTAVNQLGIDKAVPKRILDLMGVQGLTRENVASHLQKYRFYLKRLQGVNSGGER